MKKLETPKRLINASAELLAAHLTPGARILVAVSGGPDSVAMLHVLKALPYQWVIGHVDHQLRRGSAKDAWFVRNLAKDWEIPFRMERVNVKRHAARQGQGVEEAARELRYKALLGMAEACRCEAIVTAHTADDQAETVLMNFLRGAGSSGLAGIPAHRVLDGRRPVSLIRPFLKVRKSQILQYLQHNSLKFRQDPSNASFQFSRNRIRHSTLPYLEKLAPGLSERLVQSADVFRQEEDFWAGPVRHELRESVRKMGQRFTVVLPKLLGYHKALSRRILRHILPGLSFQDIEKVLRLARAPERTGWLDLPGNRRVKREKNTLVVVQKRTG